MQPVSRLQGGKFSDQVVKGKHSLWYFCRLPGRLDWSGFEGAIYKGS